MGPLTLIGSAETSPGMVKVHRAILDALPSNPRVVYLDTPYGFQENADLISAKVAEYFDVSLNQRIEIASLRNATSASGAAVEAFRIAIEQANYIFAGPGSPSYALVQWKAVDAIRSMTRASSAGAAISLASAAAVTAGRYAIPVYEIYKVGATPRWLEGINVLAATTGLDAVVVPHWDNTDGEHHDTRHCYIGRRRLDELISQLPHPLPIVGIDEHTAVTFHEGSVSVTGRGRLTVLTGREEQTMVSGETAPLSDLFEGAAIPPEPTAEQPEPTDFRSALEANDALAAADAILMDLDETTSKQTRRMVVELAQAASGGEPTEAVGPFVDLLMETRNRARARGDFGEADLIRDALAKVGVAIQDGPDRSGWTLKT